MSPYIRYYIKCPCLQLFEIIRIEINPIDTRVVPIPLVKTVLMKRLPFSLSTSTIIALFTISNINSPWFPVPYTWERLANLYRISLSQRLATHRTIERNRWSDLYQLLENVYTSGFARSTFRLANIWRLSIGHLQHSEYLAYSRIFLSRINSINLHLLHARNLKKKKKNPPIQCFFQRIIFLNYFPTKTFRVRANRKTKSTSPFFQRMKNRRSNWRIEWTWSKKINPSRIFKPFPVTEEDQCQGNIRNEYPSLPRPNT